MKAIFKYLPITNHPQTTFYFGENKKNLSLLSNIKLSLINSITVGKAGSIFYNYNAKQ